MPNRPLQFFPSPKWVRAWFAGETVVSSTAVLLLREAGHLPVYYFPEQDVRMDLLAPAAHRTRCPVKGEASYWDLRVGERTVANAAWAYRDPLPDAQPLRGRVAFYWDRMDAWFEEAEQVFVHPRDPFSRIDVIHSSRAVEVQLAGRTLAHTTRPVLLFETGLPVRHYLPPLDIRLDLLRPSGRLTRCPYKGEAMHYSAHLGDDVIEDVAWSYRYPLPEVAKIAGLFAFYDERVDTYVNDARQEPPRTRWS